MKSRSKGFYGSKEIGLIYIGEVCIVFYNHPIEEKLCISFEIPDPEGDPDGINTVKYVYISDNKGKRTEIENFPYKIVYDEYLEFSDFPNGTSYDDFKKITENIILEYVTHDEELNKYASKPLNKWRS